MLTSLKIGIKAMARQALVPVIYRFPPAGLRADRLAIYLKALVDRAHMTGDVAEIGCNLGGTSILGNRALKVSGWRGNYICYDTFGGFAKDQFDADQEKGTTSNKRFDFAANSDALVRKIFKFHKSEDIKTVKGDIAKISDERLSPIYIAGLIDVDLSIPTYEGLKRLYPRLAKGGIIYIDDCPEGDNWKARAGYQQFVQEFGLPEEYDHGLGVVRKA
jgi:hypothetical protein